MNRIDQKIDRIMEVVHETSSGANTSFYDCEAAMVAELAIMRRFRAFAGQLNPGDDLDSYFHPLNRSNWQKDFANWLIEQNREASND